MEYKFSIRTIIGMNKSILDIIVAIDLLDTYIGSLEGRTASTSLCICTVPQLICRGPLYASAIGIRVFPH
jgi:hypothetical protein